jgi:hypothetical protein
MSWAGVLGGQLAEATERPDKPSARAEFLEETLLSFEAGSDSAEGEDDAEGAAAPPIDV